MIYYIKNFLNGIYKDVNGVTSIPYANHIFSTTDKPMLLYKDNTQFYHHNITNILFLCKRLCPDIQISVEFFTTKVKAAVDNHEWNK